MTTRITAQAESTPATCRSDGASHPELRATISGRLVKLRQYTLDDVDCVFEAAFGSRFELARWLPWCHAGYCRDETAAFIESRPEAWRTGEEFSFAVIDAESDRFLGGCGINQINWQHLIANLGYWIRSDAAGRGFATAAVLTLAPAALEDLALERVEIWADVNNTASRRVAEKCGAKLEAIARRRLRVRDDQRDAAGYSLVRDDFGLPPREQE